MTRGFVALYVLIAMLVLALVESTPHVLSRFPRPVSKAERVAINFRNLRAAFENWWNIERPTSIPLEVPVEELVRCEYLDAVPKGFSETIRIRSVPGRPGVYEVEIVYTAGDVTGVERYYSEVRRESGVYVLRFKVQKWW